jgi:hypothetical protein
MRHLHISVDEFANEFANDDANVGSDFDADVVSNRADDCSPADTDKLDGGSRPWLSWTSNL